MRAETRGSTRGPQPIPYEVPLQKFFPEIFHGTFSSRPPGTLFKEAVPENRIEIASELPEIQSNVYGRPKAPQAPPPPRKGTPSKNFSPRHSTELFSTTPPGTLFREAVPGKPHRKSLQNCLRSSPICNAPPPRPPPLGGTPSNFFPRDI